MQDEDTSIDKNADADTVKKTEPSHASDVSHTEGLVTHPAVEKMLPLCTECKHAIPSGARKCKECNSFQDWRRYLVLGGTALSLLVALLSVSGIVVPLLVSTLSEKTAILNSKVTSIDNGIATILVANSGTADGYAGAVSVVSDNVEHYSDTRHFSAVKASSSLPIVISLREDQRTFISASGICEVRIELLDHALESSTKSYNVTCLAFR